MKTITKYRFKIEECDKIKAKKHNYNNEHKKYIGNLGEIASSKYLGVDWEDAGFEPVDILDSDGTKYQVKTTQETSKAKRHWLAKQAKEFDRYLLCIVDEKKEEVTIEADCKKEIAHANQQLLKQKTGKEIPCIYRK